METLYNFIIFMSDVGLDTYYEGLIKNNIIFGGILFGILKIFAVLTPNTNDDKIVTMLQNKFSKKDK